MLFAERETVKIETRPGWSDELAGHLIIDQLPQGLVIGIEGVGEIGLDEATEARLLATLQARAAKRLELASKQLDQTAQVKAQALVRLARANGCTTQDEIIMFVGRECMEIEHVLGFE